MLFHSFQFAIFFPVVFGLYLVLPHKWQNRMLLLASYIFYGAWDWRYCSLLLVSTVVDYWCGRGLADCADKRRRKQFVALSVTVNLTLLGIFKYFDFFAISFQQLMGQFGLVVHPYMLDVALPIGISFYTFQTMSYTIDVYRKKLDATDDILDFALYVAFFPQLIAGPIERGMRLLPQILQPREVTAEKIYQGIYFFGWGLFLKVFVADNLAKIVDPVFAEGATHQGMLVVLGTYAFAIQIYADFAGYSFMAIGMALAMGIELMENFRRPYFSRNISEFWRRWHISLSSWFRDYMFSPFYLYCEKQPVLSRFKLKTRHGIAFFAALLATEFLLGLWHGAAWTFAFFGIFHALAIWDYYNGAPQMGPHEPLRADFPDLPGGLHRLADIPGLFHGARMEHVRQPVHRFRQPPRSRRHRCGAQARRLQRGPARHSDIPGLEEGYPGGAELAPAGALRGVRPAAQPGHGVRPVRQPPVHLFPVLSDGSGRR